MRRALLLSVLLAAVGAVPAEAATKVKRFNPWNEAGDPLIKRYVHGDAECTRASAVNSRDDAWRCVSGNVTLDPCFQSPTDDEVLCAAAPWARQGYLLSALLEPDDHGTSPAKAPWALVVRRRRCTQVARRPGKPRRPTYRCGRRGPFLFGRPSTRRKTWTIRLARNKKGRGARRVRVRTAWT
jgi:hypothetical protein